MNSLLTYIKDKDTGEPVFSASVQLSNTSLGFNETLLTDIQGRALFIPLESETYNLQVTADSYATTTDFVVVSGPVEKIVEIEFEEEL